MESTSITARPWEAIDALLALEDEEALETALAAAPPAVTVGAIATAPSLEQKTTLLWAMEDRQRRDTLEHLPPALVGALVQNLEEDNRYLLGDLSLEQFRALLALCNPERKYYWITTALSFTDARANALPLLLPTPELAEILLTRAEFEEHLRTLGDYPLEDQRLPPDLMQDPAQTLVDLFGAENFLRVFPIADDRLAQVVQTILDFDADRYADIIRTGLHQSDYGENHPLEWDALTEDPVLLDELPKVEVPVLDLEEEAEADTEALPLALVPVTAPPLARLAASLAPAARSRVGAELQQLYIRQAVAEGGSFHLADLARIARSVEAYLLVGLRAEAGGAPDREADILTHRPLRAVSRNGARIIEGLRQVAYRIAPLEAVLDPGQQAFVRSLLKPRLILGPDGSPRLALLPAEALPESVDVPTATAMTEHLARWSAVARGLGLERTARALKEAGSTEQLLGQLVLGAVLYGRVEPGLAEERDRATLAARYLSPEEWTPLPEARANLARAASAWAAAAGIDPTSVLPLFDAELDRLAAAIARGE